MSQASKSHELLRNRKINNKLSESGNISNNSCDDDEQKLDSNQILKLRWASSTSYHLTRIVLIRYIAFVYAVAFLVAFNQNRQLLGDNGLKPVNKYLKQVKDSLGYHGSQLTTEQAFKLFLKSPTLLWFVNYSRDINTWLDMIAFSGLVISLIIVWMGSANSIQMFVLWLLYHSIVNVGQTWYSFGWESQLLESGFIAIFLVPLFSLKKLNTDSPPSFVCILLYRWLIVRIMLGAGLIKIRGDKCWKDLTCMNYHYETQPVPNPLSYYMHQEPEVFHKFEVIVNHFVELVAPFFILVPYSRSCRIFGGIIQTIFQAVLITSGNLSFLNWLTILPALACFDDASLQFLFSKKQNSVLYSLLKHEYLESIGKVKPVKPSIRRRFRSTVDIILFSIVFYLSLPVISNLLSETQAMNTSFEPFRLVNTYGAFGSVTKKRHEVIFMGTHSTDLTKESDVVWKEYEFKCKPGNVYRRPCTISPYHYRLDWLMWFAAFQNADYNPWLYSLSAKFLLNDKQFCSKAISYNPFMDDKPPRYVKADLFLYKFSKIGSNATNWWTRKLVRNYLPPIRFEQLEQYVKDLGWKYKKPY